MYAYMYVRECIYRHQHAASTYTHVYFYTRDMNSVLEKCTYEDRHACIISHHIHINIHTYIHKQTRARAHTHTHTHTILDVIPFQKFISFFYTSFTFMYLHNINKHGTYACLCVYLLKQFISCFYIAEKLPSHAPKIPILYVCMHVCVCMYSRRMQPRYSHFYCMLSVCMYV